MDRDSLSIIVGGKAHQVAPLNLKRFKKVEKSITKVVALNDAGILRPETVFHECLKVCQAGLPSVSRRAWKKEPADNIAKIFFKILDHWNLAASAAGQMR
jgi:hypothetical protein